jgi:hypothetical protein
MKIVKNIIATISIFCLIGCSYRPIFDRNAKYETGGEKAAQADFDLCKKEADDYLDQFKAERAAKEAGRKGVIGPVIGTVFGFLVGGNLSSTLGGTLIGGGVGAAAGGLGVLGEDKVTPDEMKQRYITKCLAQKGYGVMGWK